jgi:hypothetical protein
MPIDVVRQLWKNPGIRSTTSIVLDAMFFFFQLKKEKIILKAVSSSLSDIK